MHAHAAGYSSDMTSVLPYLLAVLLIPLSGGLMLFAMARLEGEPTSADGTPIPQAP